MRLDHSILNSIGRLGNILGNRTVGGHWHLICLHLRSGLTAVVGHWLVDRLTNRLINGLWTGWLIHLWAAAIATIPVPPCTIRIEPVYWI